jgi:hypothetical protein
VRRDGPEGAHTLAYLVNTHIEYINIKLTRHPAARCGISEFRVEKGRMGKGTVSLYTFLHSSGSQFFCRGQKREWLHSSDMRLSIWAGLTRARRCQVYSLFGQSMLSHRLVTSLPWQYLVQALCRRQTGTTREAQKG